MAIAAARIEPAAAMGSGFRLDRAESSHFQPHIGDSFTVFPSGGSGRARVRLAKVRDTWSTKQVVQFSLVFHGASGDTLADGIHEFHHPALGSFSIFINAIGTAAAGPRSYQACFSRHVRT